MLICYSSPRRLIAAPRLSGHRIRGPTSGFFPSDPATSPSNRLLSRVSHSDGSWLGVTVCRTGCGEEAAQSQLSPSSSHRLTGTNFLLCLRIRAISSAVENWFFQAAGILGGNRHIGLLATRWGKLVLIHSNCLSLRLSLFQLARCLNIRFWQQPEEVGRECADVWERQSWDAESRCDWPEPHSCEQRRDQLPEIQCSFLSTQG